jgi:hypothetical protein
MPVDEEEKSRRIKDRIRFHVWQSSGITGAALCLGLLFVLLAVTPAPDALVDGPGGTPGHEAEIASANLARTYWLDGELYADAAVRLNASDTWSAGDYSLQGISSTAGRPIDQSNVTVEKGWRALVQLKLHDAEDTSFSFRLFRDGTAVGSPWSIPSDDRVYIVAAELEKNRELREPDRLVVSVYNSGETLEPGILTVKLVTPLFAEPLIDQKVQSNEVQVCSGCFWEAVFELDPLESAEEILVTLEVNGGKADDLKVEPE